MPVSLPITGAKVGNELGLGTPYVRNLVLKIFPTGLGSTNKYGTKTKAYVVGFGNTDLVLAGVIPADWNFYFGEGAQLVFARVSRLSLSKVPTPYLRNQSQGIFAPSITHYAVGTPYSISHARAVSGPGTENFDFIFSLPDTPPNFEFAEAGPWTQSIFTSTIKPRSTLPSPVLEIPQTIYPDLVPVKSKGGMPLVTHPEDRLTLNFVDPLETSRDFLYGEPAAYPSALFPVWIKPRTVVGRPSVRNAAQDIRTTGIAPKTKAGQPVLRDTKAEFFITLEFLQDNVVANAQNIALTFAPNTGVNGVVGINSMAFGTPFAYLTRRFVEAEGIPSTAALGTPEEVYNRNQIITVVPGIFRTTDVGHPSVPRQIKPLGNIYTALRSGNAWLVAGAQQRFTASSINTQAWGNAWVARKTRILFAMPGPALTTTFGNTWISHERRSFVVNVVPFSESFGSHWVEKTRTIKPTSFIALTTGNAWAAPGRSIRPPSYANDFYGAPIVYNEGEPPPDPEVFNQNINPQPFSPPLLGVPTVAWTTFDQTINVPGRPSTFLAVPPTSVYNTRRYFNMTYRLGETWEWGHNENQFGYRLTVTNVRTSLNINGLNSLRLGFPFVYPDKAPLAVNGFNAGAFGDPVVANQYQYITPPSIVDEDTRYKPHEARNYRSLILHDGYSFRSSRFGNQTRVKDLRQFVEPFGKQSSHVEYPFISHYIRSIDVADRGIDRIFLTGEPWISEWTRYIEVPGWLSERGAVEAQTTIFERRNILKMKPVVRPFIVGTPNISNVTPELFVRGHDNEADGAVGKHFISAYVRRVRPSTIGTSLTTTQKPWVTFIDREIYVHSLWSDRGAVGTPRIRFDPLQWPPPEQRITPAGFTRLGERFGLARVIDTTSVDLFFYAGSEGQATAWGVPVVYQFQLNPSTISPPYHFGIPAVRGGVQPKLHPSGMDYKFKYGQPKVFIDKLPQEIHPGWPFKNWENSMPPSQSWIIKRGSPEVQHKHRSIFAFGWYHQIGQPTVRVPVPPVEFIPGVGDVYNVPLPIPPGSPPSTPPVYVQVPVDGGTTAVKLIRPIGIKSYKSAAPRIDSTIAQEIRPFLWVDSRFPPALRHGKPYVYDPNAPVAEPPPDVIIPPPPPPPSTTRTLRPTGYVAGAFGPLRVEYFHRYVVQAPPAFLVSKFGEIKYLGVNPRPVLVNEGAHMLIFGFNDGESPPVGRSKGFISYRNRPLIVVSNWHGRAYPRHRVRRALQTVALNNNRGIPSPGSGRPAMVKEWENITCRGWQTRLQVSRPEVQQREPP